jgi:V-type H+-transporting ATPase subunit F
MQDSITGLLLAGTGHVTSASKKNFMVVDSSQSNPFPLPILNHELPQYTYSLDSHMCDHIETSVAEIQKAFDEFTTERDDIAIVLINQHVSGELEHKIVNLAR